MAAPKGYAHGSWGYTNTPTKSTKTHTRHASYAPTSYGYPTTEQAQYYSPPTYNSSGYYRAQFIPSKTQDFKSSTDRMRSKARGYSTGDSGRPRVSSGAKYSSSKYEPASKSHRTYVVDEDEAYYSQSSGATPPPPYRESSRNYYVDDHYAKTSSTKKPVKTPERTSSKKETKSTRARASSYSTPKPTPQKTTARPRTSSSAKPAAKATADDARKAGIPAGYSYKNWDPDEEPILLLGSVFDANSLGKWIYDWTVYRTGPATPMSEVAGELWLLLIQLAGKIKRADACVPRIRRLDNRDMVEDFLESGERIWARFGKILKICEDYMWKVAKKEAARKGTSSAAVVMGPKSGCEFVDSMFGRDRRLEDTEKLMTSIRLWSVRFDTNCEAILRRPSA
ncbi:MAG: hypothetical protein M1828_007420 [Chrysothrix sp. TS-e1954]|nr:MAG: hypothetical protein M1828_007420 [Chrysothrix sp. TS-e1954]